MLKPGDLVLTTPNAVTWPWDGMLEASTGDMGNKAPNGWGFHMFLHVFTIQNRDLSSKTEYLKQDTVDMTRQI